MSDSLASRTRAAVRSNPFLYDALRADVVNYTAAARFLDVSGGDDDAVVAALRRFADDLPPLEQSGRDARVSMQSGLGHGDRADALLVVGETALVPDAGSKTAITARGEGDPTVLAHVLAHLDAEGIEVDAAAVGDECLVVVTERRAGPDGLRAVERGLETVPDE